MDFNRTMLGIAFVSALGIGYALFQMLNAGVSSTETIVSPGLWQFTIEESQTIKTKQLSSRTTSLPARTTRSCQRKAVPFTVPSSNIGGTCTFKRYSVAGTVDVDEVCTRPDGVTQRHIYSGSVTRSSIRVKERIESSGKGISTITEKTTVAQLMNSSC